VNEATNIVRKPITKSLCAGLLDEMYRGKTVAVVVPAYNEAGLVGDVIDAIPDYVDRVYAVDDCSTDETWEEIRAQAGGVTATEPSPAEADGVPMSEALSDGGQVASRVVPIRHETNQGVGGAIKTGYARAREEGIELTAVVNGDGQMDPSILDRFLDPIVDDEADYTKGNRLTSPDLRAEMSTWRFGGNALLTFLTKIASGYWKMTDPQNGYTAASLDVLEAIDLDVLYDRYGFLNDLLIELNTRGFRIRDVPMEAAYGDEHSGIAYSSFVPRLSSLLLIGFLRRLKTRYLVTDFHPLVFLYSLGAIGLALGAGYAGWATLGGLHRSASVALLTVLFSATLVVHAMILDMRYNEHLEPNHARGERAIDQRRR